MNIITKKLNSKNITRYKQLAFAISFCLLSSFNLHGITTKELYERANKGHIDAMYTVCGIYIIQFLNAKTEKEKKIIYKLIITELTRIKLRRLQDLACCKDPTAQKIEILSFKLKIDFLETGVFFLINDSTRTAIVKEVSPKVFLWLQKLTTNEKLPDPYYVLKDGIYTSFFGATKEEVFLPKEEWQKMRQNIIDKISNDITNRFKPKDTE